MKFWIYIIIAFMIKIYYFPDIKNISVELDGWWAINILLRYDDSNKLL